MSRGNRQRLLYHFTSEASLPAILGSAEIVVSLGPPGRQFGQSPLRVVWLTDDADPGTGRDHGLSTSSGDAIHDKRAVRITVAVSGAQHWHEWAERRHVSRRMFRKLDEAGGGLSERWWVCPRPILADDWVRVEDLRTGEVIWPRLAAARYDAAHLTAV